MARTLKSDKLLFWATLLLVGVIVILLATYQLVRALT